jgi:hypothetical protein
MATNVNVAVLVGSLRKESFRPRQRFDAHLSADIPAGLRVVDRPERHALKRVGLPAGGG